MDKSSDKLSDEIKFLADTIKVKKKFHDELLGKIDEYYGKIENFKYKELDKYDEGT